MCNESHLSIAYLLLRLVLFYPDIWRPVSRKKEYELEINEFENSPPLKKVMVRKYH